MKRALSIILALVLSLLPCLSFAMQKEASIAKLSLSTEPEITALVKLETDVAARLEMDDGGPLPSDLKYKLRNTKYATISKDGILTGKKPGSVDLTVSSQSMNQNLTVKVNVKANGFEDDRSLEQLMALERLDPAKHYLLSYVRKVYFANGKLTVDLYFYNRFGFDIIKIFGLHMNLYDATDGSLLSSYNKKVVRTKKLKTGEFFKLTYSFPKKGLDRKYDLTALNSEGFQAQIQIDGGFAFDYGYPFEDPWGEWGGMSIKRADKQQSTALIYGVTG